MASHCSDNTIIIYCKYRKPEDIMRTAVEDKLREAAPIITSSQPPGKIAIAPTK